MLSLSNMIVPSYEKHYRDDRNFEIEDYNDAVEISEAIQSPESLVKEKFLGLEIVTTQGDVELISGTEEGHTNRRTTLSTLPLVQYDKDGSTHQVNLYARHSEDSYDPYLRPQLSVFIVDKVTDSDGATRLGSLPGLLYRQSSQMSEGRSLEQDRVFQTSLSTGVLAALDGPEGILKLANARRQGDQATIDLLEEKLRNELKDREIERELDPTRNGQFNEQEWEIIGSSTPTMRLEERQERERVLAERDRLWQRMSKARKLGVKTVAILKGLRGVNLADDSLKHSYFIRKNKKSI